MKERLVLIGNGMAGIRTLEELFKLEEAERYETGIRRMASACTPVTRWSRSTG
jgi:NAD(P)H-nitrite reductase large subunit